MGFRADIRAAAVTLMTGYNTANAGALRQIYPGRPMSIYPPTGFVDAINEGAIQYTAGPRRRTPAVGIILIQGVFDSEEAVTLQDVLVDGFIDYVTVNKHAAGPSTLVTISQVDDLPNFQPDWIENAPFYFASRLTLEGLIAEGGLI
jgi:hypothetical protein